MWKKEIIDIQDESTKKIMLAQNLRPLEEDWAYKIKIDTTPIKSEAQCVKEDGTVDLNVRNLSQQEADFHNEVRRRVGATLAEIRGDEGVSTLTEEKRERAANAFMERFSLDAIKDKFKAMMGKLFKPDYAEIVAEEMKKRNK